MPAHPEGARVAAGIGLALGLACSGPAGGDRNVPEPPAGHEARSQEPPPGLEYAPPPPGSYDLPPIEPAADGEVLDADGTRRRLFDYLGDRLVLLSFVYTRCSDSEGCPLATGVLEMIQEEIGTKPGLAERARLVTLSFDPDRDTPEAMRRYALHAGGDYLQTPWDARPWVFLTTPSRAALQPILDGYGQSIVREIDAAGKPTGDFAHVLKVFLIDRRRRVRNIYSTSFLHPAIVLGDLETLVLEEAP